MDEEIDVGLFVTCRLCIEETGRYQILPAIQEQFKYCFDITVDSFDGLPQLICQKCKDILHNFYNLKNRFYQKQANLMSKYKRGIRATSMPQHDIVSSSQHADNIETNKTSAKRSDSSDSDDTIKAKRKKKKKTPCKNTIWDHTGFIKEYVCVVCTHVCPNKESFMRHQVGHYNLLAEHSIIFNKIPSVTLKKIDGKCNITGMSNTVVYNNNEIIENCNSLCYIRYSKAIKTFDGNNSEHKITENSSKKNEKIESFDTDEEITAIPKQRKRRRVVSRSSSDTVVVESNTNISSDEEKCKLPNTQLINDNHRHQLSNNECIDITDSSDSEVHINQTKATYNAKQPVEAILDDYKIIQGIINMCVKAYMKKRESPERLDRLVTTESQLKHKVLSIGRKIINRSYFNWTGLLRYMEHKNLNIVWATKAIAYCNSKNSNYIRIMTKLRETDTTDDSNGWTLVVGNDQVAVTEKSRVLDINLAVAQVVENRSSIGPTVTPQVEDVNSIQPAVTPQLTENVNNGQSIPESAILYISNNTDPKNKLLNANPVANPKQLPRKSVHNNDLRISGLLQSLAPESSAANTAIYNDEEANLCMPIITSTTSLAVPNLKEQSQNDNNTGPTSTKTSETVVPRIKVKPVTELMSQSILDSLRNEFSSAPNMLENVGNMLLENHTHHNAMNMLHAEQESETQRNSTIQNNIPWDLQGSSNNFSPNMTPQMTVAQSMQMHHSSPQLSDYALVGTSLNTTLPRIDKEEYGIMNSVELPNEKTKSPFQYLKKLFLMHNLILLDTQAILSRDFLLLIKFKVKFQQEPIDDPVILCLSLFSCKNQFCFKVKDRQELCFVNINHISANWQWEILNVFRGNIVEKLLQNAQKHSTETYNYTNNFLCLLRSVTFTKLTV